MFKTKAFLKLNNKNTLLKISKRYKFNSGICYVDNPYTLEVLMIFNKRKFIR